MKHYYVLKVEFKLIIIVVFNFWLLNLFIFYKQNKQCPYRWDFKEES